jgi:hypothetical protein
VGRVLRRPVDPISWLQGEKPGRQNDATPPHWTELRDRWEYSHVMRVVLAFGSVIALIIAVA